jgi:aryl-alcohol dehydrogenase-like predicted oxidoreductase
MPPRNYSIAGRDLEREIVPLLESEKVGLLVWSPLAGGLLFGKFTRTNQKPANSRRTEYDFPVDKERTWKILDVMAPIAKAHDCSTARVSLAWLLAKPVVTEAFHELVKGFGFAGSLHAHHVASQARSHRTRWTGMFRTSRMAGSSS